ncbi:MAG: hypothetical protein KDE51_23640 [Anaerolineales bacterium]|nr:hypothetical protein [Anaerolineales bacterium]
MIDAVLSRNRFGTSGDNENALAVNQGVVKAIRALREEDTVALLEALEQIHHSASQLAIELGQAGTHIDELGTTLFSAREICVRAARRGSYKEE